MTINKCIANILYILRQNKEWYCTILYYFVIKCKVGYLYIQIIKQLKVTEYYFKASCDVS